MSVNKKQFLTFFKFASIGLLFILAGSLLATLVPSLSILGVVLFIVGLAVMVVVGIVYWPL